ncbi:MAG: hypothetical protein IPJ65_19205 [Archangiaceae bacterium]|nr:hypothetical protein [Archangiaceae bacterium]
MSTTLRVGGEVDAFCTKCELLLAHTILAMVGPKIIRVRCNTCMGEHAFRGQVVPKSAAKPRASRASTSAAEKAEKITIAWEERLKSTDLTKARKYSPKESFAAEEVMNHPTFGYGIVSAVRGDKIDVAFKAFEKTLLHKRPDGHAARPTFGTKPAAAPQPVDEGAAPDAASTGDAGGGTVAS